MNWDEIRKEYESSTITLNALAEKYDLKIGTLKSRKSREGWVRGPTKKDATQKKKVATLKKDATKEQQRKRSGNPHPSQKFPERNTFALKHGLFSRYIPKETMEIMGMLDKADPADLIWDQIQIQYAAIIRAQQIMFVRDQDDMTREIRKESESATEWEIQFAWDKHATFMNAQSRAMSELRSLIKQFNDLAHEDDERRLKLEQMRLGIDKTKAEIDKLNGLDDEATINGLDQLTDAIRRSSSMFKGDA